MKPRHVFSSRLPGLIGANAFVLYPFVFYTFDEQISKASGVFDHELTHVRQIKAVGLIRFYLSYVLFYVAFRVSRLSKDDAYEAIPWEVDAFDSGGIKWQRYREPKEDRTILPLL